MANILPVEDQNIIKILHIEHLPEEQKLALVQTVSELVHKRLLVRVAESLNDEKLAQFQGVLERQDAKSLEAFLSANVPQFGDWIPEEVGAVKKDLGAIMPAAQKGAY